MKLFSRCSIFLLVLCLMTTLLPLSAFAGTDGIFTYEINDGQATITACDNNASGKVVVPSTIEGCPVTAIGREAFYRKDKITEIVLPNSVKTIGYYAFYGCTELSTINLPSGLTVLEACFSNCTKLTSLCIPASVQKIKTDVFWNCKSLSNVTVEKSNATFYSVGNCIIRTADKAVVFANAHSKIPSDGSVKTIATKAFSGVNELTDVVIPYGITTVEESAFSLCRNMTSIHLSETVTNFSPIASECDSLSTLTVDSKNPVYHSSGNCIIQTGTKTLIQGCKNSKIPSNGSVTAIGAKAFDDIKLTSITIPSGVTTIGELAFLYCTKLTSISLPNTLKTIGDEAFKYCYALTSISLPEGLETVGRYAFSESALSEITFPRSVSEIKVGCLSSCKKLQSVTVLNRNTKLGTGGSTLYGDITIHGYAGSTAETYAIKYSKTFVALNGHTCAYEQKVTTGKYLSSTASCTAPAKYFYSCTCGAKGTKTFTHGDVLAHTYDNACDPSCNACKATRTAPHAFSDTWKSNDRVHWHACTCGAKSGESTHTWDIGTVTQKPTETENGTLLFTCTICGAKRTEDIAPTPSVTVPTEPTPTEPAPTEPTPTEPSPTEPSVPSQTEPTVQTQTNPPESTAPTISEAPVSLDKEPSLIWIIPVSLVVIGLVILIIFLLKRKKEKE